MRERSSGPKGESISLPLTRRLDPTSRSAFPVLLSLSLPLSLSLSLSRHYARARGLSFIQRITGDLCPLRVPRLTYNRPANYFQLPCARAHTGS